MADKESMSNEVFHAARAALLDCIAAGLAPELDPDKATYGFGTCNLYEAGKGWRDMDSDRRRSVLQAMAVATEVREPTRIAEAAAFLLGLHMEDLDLDAMQSELWLPYQIDWSNLPQREHDANYFWIAAADMAARQISTTNPRICWIFKLYMRAVIDRLEPSPLKRYFRRSE